MKPVPPTSPDLLADNVATLRTLFPEAFTEDGLDFDVLRELLGGELIEHDERYGLSWHGKARARRLALTPSTGTLRPDKEASEAWDTTKNLIIEGDNLEVLKLLQRSYAGQVKLIYIDPPYNTGHDFVYADDFRDNIRNYLQKTGQVDEEGATFTSNTEASGRFHTDWLNMMYPRLVLARQLLAEDGAVVVSVDDQEAHSLRHLLNAVFGAESFAAKIVWKARKFPDARAKTRVSTDHEYLLVYFRAGAGSFRGVERDESKFSNPDGDPRGPWMSRSMLGLATKAQRPNLHYPITDPDTGNEFDPAPQAGWRYSRDRMQGLIDSGSVLFPSDAEGRPREKKFRADLEHEFATFPSIIDGIHTSDGTAEVRALMGTGVFDFPKPSALVKLMVEQLVAKPSDLILDFFAGSGTTAHAVMAQNAEDGGKGVMIQRRAYAALGVRLAVGLQPV